MSSSSAQLTSNEVMQESSAGLEHSDNLDKANTIDKAVRVSYAPGHKPSRDALNRTKESQISTFFQKKRGPKKRRNHGRGRPRKHRKHNGHSSNKVAKDTGDKESCGN